jgi:hypothetical protein
MLTAVPKAGLCKSGRTYGFTVFEYPLAMGDIARGVLLYSMNSSRIVW